MSVSTHILHKPTFSAVVLDTCMLQFEMTHTLYDCSRICPKQIGVKCLCKFSFTTFCSSVVLLNVRFYTRTCTHRVGLWVNHVWFLKNTFFLHESLPNLPMFCKTNITGFYFLLSENGPKWCKSAGNSRRYPRKAAASFGPLPQVQGALLSKAPEARRFLSIPVLPAWCRWAWKMDPRETADCIWWKLQRPKQFAGKSSCHFLFPALLILGCYRSAGIEQTQKWNSIWEWRKMNANTHDLAKCSSKAWLFCWCNISNNGLDATSA